jgi:hypothetical protein
MAVQMHTNGAEVRDGEAMGNAMPLTAITIKGITVRNAAVAQSVEHCADVVPQTGLEPVTLAFSVRCSTD